MNKNSKYYNSRAYYIRHLYKKPKQPKRVKQEFIRRPKKEKKSSMSYDECLECAGLISSSVASFCSADCIYSHTMTLMRKYAQELLNASPSLETVEVDTIPASAETTAEQAV